MKHENDTERRFATAGEWYVELDIGPVDAAIDRKFAAWLAGNSEHEHALERCEAAMHATAFLRDDPDLRWAFDEIDTLAKRDGKDVSNVDSRTPKAGPPYAWSAAAVVGIVLAALLAPYVAQRPVEDVAPSGAGLINETPGTELMGDTLAPDTLADPTVELPVIRTRSSIAVLPFNSLSPDARDAFFTRAMRDEVLSQLARLRGVKVVSQTSLIPFESTEHPIAKIGEALGAETILEAAVSYYADDRVRVSVQLIDAAPGLHLWAATYDRPLADVLEIAADIAKNVAGALGTDLDPDAGVTAADDAVPIVRVDPQWPREALIEGIEGWVEVEYTILPDGSVADPIVLASEPPRVFDRSAMRAILRWKFRPRIVNGQPVARRAVQRIDFRLTPQ